MSISFLRSNAEVWLLLCRKRSLENGLRVLVDEDRTIAFTLGCKEVLLVDWLFFWGYGCMALCVESCDRKIWRSMLEPTIFVVCKFRWRNEQSWGEPTALIFTFTSYCGRQRGFARVDSATKLRAILLNISVHQWIWKRILYLFENCMFRSIYGVVWNHLILTSLPLSLLKQTLNWLGGWGCRLDSIIRVILGWGLTGEGRGRLRCCIISYWTRELLSILRIFAKLYKFEEKRGFLLR